MVAAHQPALVPRCSQLAWCMHRVLASGLYTNFDPATCSFLSAGGRALDDSTSGMEPSPRHKDFDGDDELATFLLQCFHHGQPSSHKAHAVAGGAASTAVALPSLDPSTQDGTVAPAFASPHVVAQYNHGLMAALRVARRRIISLQGVCGTLPAVRCH